MKKPNISKGPWYPVEYAGLIVIQDEDSYHGHNLIDKDHFALAENNAKAISAVPDMIDALLVAKRRMNDELEHLDTNDLFMDNEQYQSFVNDIEVVNKALIKAGVEL